MLNDIFRVFGEQTAVILFEIITECVDDYLYIFELQNDTFEISQSAVERLDVYKRQDVYGVGADTFTYNALLDKNTLTEDMLRCV